MSTFDRRPLIGICPNFYHPDTWKFHLGTYQHFIASLQDAGADSITLTPSLDAVPRYLSLVDGFLLTGGDDIHPRYYHKKVSHPEQTTISPNGRTDFEIEICRQANIQKKPILGVCLGFQTMAVAFGGELDQHFGNSNGELTRHKNNRHSVQLALGSALESILNTRSFQVNSRHHQGVRELPPKLRQAAWASDGIVEALEIPEHPFFIGVQWHPEEMKRSQKAKALFSAFVQACQKTLST